MRAPTIDRNVTVPMSSDVTSAANALTVSLTLMHSVAAYVSHVSGASSTAALHRPWRSVAAVYDLEYFPFNVWLIDTVAPCNAAPSPSTTMPESVTERNGESVMVNTSVSSPTVNSTSSGLAYTRLVCCPSVTRHTSRCPSGTSPSDAVLRR